MGIGIAKNHPNKKNLSFLVLLFSRKKKYQENTGREVLWKRKWRTFVLWNRVILDFSLVPFMTWGKELNGEATIFSDLRYLKKVIRSFPTWTND